MIKVTKNKFALEFEIDLATKKLRSEVDFSTQIEMSDECELGRYSRSLDFRQRFPALLGLPTSDRDSNAVDGLA